LFAKAQASNTAFMKAFASGETLAQIEASVPNFSPPGITTTERHTHEPRY
jgi:hypothetical protein